MREPSVGDGLPREGAKGVVSRKEGEDLGVFSVAIILRVASASEETSKYDHIQIGDSNECSGMVSACGLDDVGFATSTGDFGAWFVRVFESRHWTMLGKISDRSSLLVNSSLWQTLEKRPIFWVCPSCLSSGAD